MLEPAVSKIVIKELGSGKEMDGGIFIVESARKKSEMYLVMAIGKEGKDGNGDPVYYPEVGAVVITAQYGGVEVTYKGTSYRIISYLDVLATVPFKEAEHMKDEEEN